MQDHYLEFMSLSAVQMELNSEPMLTTLEKMKEVIQDVVCLKFGATG